MTIDIEQLAKNMGFDAERLFVRLYNDGVRIEHLAQFAALVAEFCARECELLANHDYCGFCAYGPDFAAAIRVKFALSGDAHEAHEAK